MPVEMTVRQIHVCVDIPGFRTSKKELTMYLIEYNLIRSIMLEAAQTHGGEALRISFKRTADGLRQWTPAIRAARGPARNRLIEALLACIAKLIIPHRPDRAEPRAIKRRKKNFQLLNSSTSPENSSVKSPTETNILWA